MIFHLKRQNRFLELACVQTRVDHFAYALMRSINGISLDGNDHTTNLSLASGLGTKLASWYYI